MCRDCEERLGGGRLRRALECQIYVSRLRRTPRGWLLWRASRCQIYVSRLRRAPRGVAAFGEPPSAKFMCRDCEERLEGGLLRRAPECQVYVSRLRRTPRGVADSASPRVP